MRNIWKILDRDLFHHVHDIERTILDKLGNFLQRGFAGLNVLDEGIDHSSSHLLVLNAESLVFRKPGFDLLEVTHAGIQLGIRLRQLGDIRAFFNRGVEGGLGLIENALELRFGNLGFLIGDDLFDEMNVSLSDAFDDAVGDLVGDLVCKAGGVLTLGGLAGKKPLGKNPRGPAQGVP